MRSVPVAPRAPRWAAVAAVALLLVTGCRKQPTIEEVPSSRYTTPSTSESAAP